MQLQPSKAALELTVMLKKVFDFFKSTMLVGPFMIRGLEELTTHLKLLLEVAVVTELGGHYSPVSGFQKNYQFFLIYKKEFFNKKNFKEI